MTVFSRQELAYLVSSTAEPCVSIYMPTHRVGAETREGPIRLKNLAREAERQLTGGGLPPRQATELLRPVEALLEDTLFWSYRSDGLALFSSVELFRCYSVPVALNELVVVSRRFHVKPLLQLLTGDGRFYVLALSQNKVRLLEATRHRVRDVSLEGVPQSLDEALRYDDKERQLQFHTPAPVGRGEQAAVFHGQGVGIDDAKNDILRFFRYVDQGLGGLLKTEKAPLVLACVEYLLPIYKEANTFHHLMDEGISGNPEALSPEELHDRAWAIVEPHFLKARQDAADRYTQMAGTERASAKLAHVVPAAYHGTIEDLFVAVGVQKWGVFDADTGRVYSHQEPEPGDEDLLDFAAVHTLLRGGTVYAVPPQKVPGHTPLAAVFRY